MGVVALLASTAAAADPPPAAPDPVDSARDAARSTTEWLARGLNSLFGDKPFEQGGKATDGRLDLGVLHRPGQGNDYNLRFSAHVRLPNLEDKTHLFVGRDDQHDVVADTPNAFSRQDRVQPAQRAESTFFAGLGYDWRENVDFRLGLRGGLKPYAQARFHDQWMLAPDDIAQFRQTLFWSLSEGFGSTTALAYEHAYTPTLALHWLSAGTITQRKRALEWSSVLGLVKDLGHERLIATEAIADGITDSGVPVREWGARMRWQQPLHRSWLLGEVIFGRYWVRRDAMSEREGEWAVGLGLKMSF